MRVEYISFASRSARSKYIANRFKRFLAGKILDVGCDKAVLRKLLPGVDYTGVDVAGDPDIRLNIEDVSNLPFDDGSFDCVVCSDVLEHLDNLHQIFGELIRVARKYVIISLPNNWSNARIPIARGKGSFGHYGLPIDPPQDRHKWFFAASEATNFLRAQVRKYAISILEIHATEKPRLLLARALRRLLYPSQECYLNRYAHTIWVVFEKK
jgi:2-polyprenyl-3-methyl-5-hydroxy-6-metoxy-1,4-benzoquinol methylase